LPTSWEAGVSCVILKAYGSGTLRRDFYIGPVHRRRACSGIIPREIRPPDVGRASSLRDTDVCMFLILSTRPIDALAEPALATDACAAMPDAPGRESCGSEDRSTVPARKR
jgi:hypothetical protein